MGFIDRAVRIALAVLALVPGAACAKPLASPPPAPRPPPATIDVALRLVDTRDSPVILRGPDLVRRDGAPIPWPSSPGGERGVKGTATRKTPLYFNDAPEKDTIGWLEPGASVTVVAGGKRVEVQLDAWRGGPRAWVERADLSDARPLPPALFDDAPPGTKILSEGQFLLRERDEAQFTSSFCSPVTVLEERGERALVAQKDDGVVVRAWVDKRGLTYATECPQPLMVTSMEGEKESRAIFRRGRMRPWESDAPPAGLVAAGPYTGPTLGELVRTGARIYWLSPDEKRGELVCEPWKLEKKGDEVHLVSRTKLEDGDTLITHFGFESSPGGLESAGITLLGPHNEVVAPPGRTPQSGGISFACGSTYTVVGARDGVMSVLPRYLPITAGRVLAYVPTEAERWYTTRAACEKDAATARALRTQGAHLELGFALHGGC